MYRSVASGFRLITGKGSVMISKADSEVTELDVRNVLNTAESELPQQPLLTKK